MSSFAKAYRHDQSLSVQKIREIIEIGENNGVEFKRRFSDFEKIAKEMIAFTNTRGGRILIGVDDDGTIVGVDSEKHEIELVTTAGEFYCDPAIDADIEVIEIDGVDVIAVTIPESRTKPHYLISQTNGLPRNDSIGKKERKGQELQKDRRRPVYIRQEDRSVVVSKEVERVLAANHPNAAPLRIHIGKIEQVLFDYLEENHRITLREFCHLLNISERRASRVMVRLVRAGIIRIFTHEAEDYYTLS
ncbi:MAG: ATP-binding protein [Chlorobi bacterium]|nr:ATP-binding protein [Chlorobiota bacterium]